MKYEKEIDNLLREMFYEKWMSDKEYEDMISEIFKMANISKDKLDSDIEIGINNGYNLETQFDVWRKIFKLLKDS